MFPFSDAGSNIFMGYCLVLKSIGVREVEKLQRGALLCLCCSLPGPLAFIRVTGSSSDVCGTVDVLQRVH